VNRPSNLTRREFLYLSGFGLSGLAIPSLLSACDISLLVILGEAVRVLVKFDHYTGMYLYHCHNLEHVGGGMMRNYRVES
jgi:FtsP/CotA-like multicopper oxidase with cupredoxin domain